MLSRFARAPVTTLSPGIEAPGTVRFMDPSTGEVAETVKFHPGQLYDLEPGLLGLEIGGRRSTNLGLNIYKDKGQEQAVVEAVRRELSGARGSLSQGGREEESKELAKEELNLLAKLIGTETDARRRDTFRLNIFDGDHGDEEVDDGDHRQAAAWNILKEENPTVVIGTPMCTAFSAWQALSVRLPLRLSHGALRSVRILGGQVLP